MLKFWFFKLSRHWKCKKWPKMRKISFCRTLYFRNHISYDLHLWYTFIYKRIISPGIVFIFIQNFDFWNHQVCVCVCVCVCMCVCVWGVVKGQKITQSDKLCLSHALSQEKYIIYCDFWYTCVKWWYLQEIFSFLKILIFGFLRVVKGQKMT